MNWSTVLQAGLAAPVAAALIALTRGRGDRVGPSVVCIAGAAAIAAASIASVTGRLIDVRGFHAGAWSGLLGAGILLVAAGACLRTPIAAERAALALCAGLATVSVLSPDRLWFGVLTATTTLAHGVAMMAAEGTPVRARVRSFTLDATSAALILLGFALDASDAIAFGSMTGTPAALVLIGALLRLGVFGTPKDSSWPGALRAQGAFACAMAGMGEAGPVVAATAGATLAAARMWIRPSAGGIEAARMAIVALGIGIGGAVAATGAALLLAASFAASAVRIAGASTLARPLLSFAPAGGALLGAALVTGAASRLGAARPVWLLAAIPALVAACLTGVAAWRTDEDPAAPFMRSATIVALGALAVLGVLAFAPAFALERAGDPLAAAMGVAPALSTGREALTESVGIAVAILAAFGLVAGGVGAARESEPDQRAAVAVPDESPGIWVPLSRAAAAAMVGLVVWLTVAAGNRGWL